VLATFRTMAFNIPFPTSINGGLPVPRRFVGLGLTIVALLLFLHAFAPTTLPPALTPHLAHHEPDASYFSPSKWIPPILNPNTPVRPLEFDENLQCLFLSPFDALSPAEKARAELLELEEVSAGVVRTKPVRAGSGVDGDEEDDEYSNSTSTAGLQTGLTHPILALLKDGEVKWNARMESQSKTLEQAVDKYIEKHGRQPPKGFDLWCVSASSPRFLAVTDMLGGSSHRSTTCSYRTSTMRESTTD
jgi:beta-1,2-xylosyltransferase